MTPATPTAEFVDVLTQAASTFQGQMSARPFASEVVNALLQAEKAAKQQKLVYPFASLLGKWQLCFATGTKKVRERGGIILGKGFYVPKLVKIYISFDAKLKQASGKGEIGNQVELAGMLLKLTGPCQYLGKKNLLAFDFTQIQVGLFGRIIYKGQVRGGEAKAQDFYDQAIAKQPFFAFFLVTEDLIAARGRGGGLALWIRS
ncbi:hypothetical protein [Iningainema tapete]|uniref:Plastid lipid-associated protein/fibrillin conserved domain-containing protein n=1 Tax=Iningainema tapete BLCC-T55 TaxID=2748662 RepID=A0A8J6XR04_9CYAN|nr:hypothetical protein [Iningainema tapete]MBD2775836.1 hypothetical protein [Iningainema tapete BLCC-T55]